MQETSSTRQIILYHLRSKGSVQIRMLAAELKLTEMAIRRHMHELIKQEYVEMTTIREGKGRPKHVYALTKKAELLFPRNYQMLTVDLLSELEEDEQTKAYIDMMFQGRKRKLYKRYHQQMAQKSLADRVDELARIQTAAGYMAEASSDASYFYVAEYNCPIKGVADRFNQACQCELQLFEELLLTTVERTECIAKGQNRCLYKIKNNES